MRYSALVEFDKGCDVEDISRKLDGRIIDGREVQVFSNEPPSKTKPKTGAESPSRRTPSIAPSDAAQLSLSATPSIAPSKISPAIEELPRPRAHAVRWPNHQILASGLPKITPLNAFLDFLYGVLNGTELLDAQMVFNGYDREGYIQVSTSTDIDAAIARLQMRKFRFGPPQFGRNPDHEGLIPPQSPLPPDPIAAQIQLRSRWVAQPDIVVSHLSTIENNEAHVKAWISEVIGEHRCHSVELRSSEGTKAASMALIRLQADADAAYCLKRLRNSRIGQRKVLVNPFLPSTAEVEMLGSSRLFARVSLTARAI
jgi:hypothetical protein